MRDECSAPHSSSLIPHPSCLIPHASAIAYNSNREIPTPDDRAARPAGAAAGGWAGRGRDLADGAPFRQPGAGRSAVRPRPEPLEPLVGEVGADRPPDEPLS